MNGILSDTSLAAELLLAEIEMEGEGWNQHQIEEFSAAAERLLDLAEIAKVSGRLSNKLAIQAAQECCFHKGQIYKKLSAINASLELEESAEGDLELQFV